MLKIVLYYGRKKLVIKTRGGKGDFELKREEGRVKIED